MSHRTAPRCRQYGGDVRRNSYALAALADAAVPGLTPVRTALIATPMDELDVAGIVGEDGRRVVVTAPASDAAGAHLEKDVHVAEALASTPLGALVPAVIGSVRLPGGGRAVVTEPAHGIPLMLDDLAESPALARALGRTLARIHSMPNYLAEAAGAESFSAAESLAAHRAQIERARAAGELPTAVAQRWEALLADRSLWDLEPTFVHGSLSEECLFHDGEQITGIRDWHEARISDPAADLAWLVSTLPPEQMDVLHRAYTADLAGSPHPRLLERAQVLGELAVVDWLLHGLDDEDEEITADARGMLADLDHDLTELAREEAERTFRELEAQEEPGEPWEPEQPAEPGEPEQPIVETPGSHAAPRD